MAIKKVTFSFDVPITQLLSLIATGNAAMKIDVYGDEKPFRLPKAALNGHAPKLLEGPKDHTGTIKQSGSVRAPRQQGMKNGKPITGFDALLTAFAKRSDNTLTMDAAREVMTDVGLSPISASSQIHLMKNRGLTRSTGKGVYQLTHRGLVEVAERKLVKVKTTNAEAAANG